ncbi:MAG: hypothetical protein RSE56_01345 [Bacilli bacterium]
MEKKTKKINMSWKEITTYVSAGVVFLFGLTIGTFSVIGDYIGPANFIKIAEQKTAEIFKLTISWRIWGLIFIFIALVILLIGLFFFANKHEKLVIKDTRKTARTTLKLKEEAIEEPVIAEEPSENV